MSSKKSKKIVILSGGISEERDISRLTANEVHKILQKKNLTHRDLLFFSFKGRSKNKGKVFSWFLIKVYKKVFYDKLTEVTKIWAEILKDLDFAERNKFKLTEVKEFGLLKEMVLKLQ